MLFTEVLCFIFSAHGHITPFHSYHLNIKAPDNLPHLPIHGGQLGSNKISIMQPRLGLQTGVAPTVRSPSLHAQNQSASYAGIPRFSAASLLHQKDIKLEPGSLPPSTGLKRDYEKMSGNDKSIHRNSQVKQETTLSPRKKPRKQTHIVAEGNVAILNFKTLRLHLFKDG